MLKNKHTFQISAGLSLLACLTGCGTEDDSDQSGKLTEPKTFLTDADLAKRADLKNLESPLIRSTLQQWEELYAKYPSTDSPDEDTTEEKNEFLEIYENCLAEKGITISATENSYALNLDIDVGECLSQNNFAKAILSQVGLDPSKLEILSSGFEKLHFKAAAVRTCKEVGEHNFSAINGLKFPLDAEKISEIVDKADCQGEISGWIQSKLIMEFEYSYKYDGFTTTTKSSSESILATFGESISEPCIEEGDGDKVTLKNCTNIEISKESYTTESDKPNFEKSNIEKDEYLKITWKNHEKNRKSEDPWFEKGTQDIEVNNWKGTITYNGTKTDPTVVLSNGTEQSEITLSPRSGTTNLINPKSLLPRISIPATLLGR